MPIKISRNISKMLWCIEIVNIYIQSKFHVSTVIFLSAFIGFSKNGLRQKSLFFMTNLKAIGNFLSLTLQSTN